jgi:CheY-like chemotaxis protein
MEKQKTEEVPMHLKFLVAEPDKDMQILYSLYFERLGLSEDRVIIAQGGKNCLEIYKNRNNKWIKNPEKEQKQQQRLSLPPPTNDNMLVILDMHLRDIPSLHVAKGIMEINPQQNMIITTTSSLEDLKNKVKDLLPITAVSEDKILFKPFRFSQLLSLINTIMIN